MTPTCLNATLRSAHCLQSLARLILETATRKWRIMEVCGGQTYTISHYMIEDMLYDKIELIHGPGCPVCVTPAHIIDNAIALALMPNVRLCTFGDMMRVPGSKDSLITARSRGANVHLLYSPIDCLALAEKHKDKEIVFFAIGFETTTPIYALLLDQIIKCGISNVSIITSLFTIPPVIRKLASEPECIIDAVLAAGHVCAITGTKAYHDISEQYRLPIVVTGFEPADILLGIYRAVSMLESGVSKTINAYRRIVSESGNISAQEKVSKYMRAYTAHWRGIGSIANSGMMIRKEYEHYDAMRRFNADIISRGDDENIICHAGDIMRGIIHPDQCPLWGSVCTPDTPVGAAMVSSEGVCSAYYRR